MQIMQHVGDDDEDDEDLDINRPFFLGQDSVVRCSSATCWSYVDRINISLKRPLIAVVSSIAATANRYQSIL